MSTYSALIGQTLSERYRIEQEIGKGGQAVVCAGTDTDSGLVRAIKLLPASFNTPPQMIERFKKESLMLTNLPAHDNVVGVFDGGYDEGLRAFFTIIEYVDGVTLADVIDAPLAEPAPGDETEIHTAAEDEATSVHIVRNTRLCTPEFAVAVIECMAKGLSHAHSFRFVHRDVKPSNILIGRDGSVKLTDFGIARIAADSGLTRTGTAVGTLSYMSPEQIQDRDLDGRSDIFSLGVVLYECLVGQTPYARVERDMIPFHILKTRPAPPTSLNADLSPAFDAIVLRALEKAPDDRYQTMDEFQAALAELVESGQVRAMSTAQIADTVAHLRGTTGFVQIESRATSDSNQRCPSCGAPLPAGWQSALQQCPGCAESLESVVPRPADWVRVLIDQARAKLDIRGRVGFDLAKYIYDRELQTPTFQEWEAAVNEAEPVLMEGTVTVPTSDGQVPGDDIVGTARRLMVAADILTDPDLTDYNHRLSERREVEALAAHARGKAYQLLGRRHTLRGSTAHQTAASRHYDNARAAFTLSAEQYRLASDAWQRYEAGERLERIEAYYQDLKRMTHQRAEWSTVADLMTQGILRFPHDRRTAYELFERARELGRELHTTPGATTDLAVADVYRNYYEDAVAELDANVKAIAAAQSEGLAVIAAAHSADAACLAEDRQRVHRWMQDRSQIAFDFFTRRANLPLQIRRVQFAVRAIGYLLVLALIVAYAGEVRHGAYDSGNPGPFWPGWPQLLSRRYGYDLNFASWHHFWVMLVGVDLLVFWPFNLLARRQFIGQRLAPAHAAVPTLSSLLHPVVDWLHRQSARTPANDSEQAPRARTLRQRAAGLAFAVAPWLPVALLTVALWPLLFGPGNFNHYLRWLAVLAIVPPLLGRVVGRRLRKLFDKLDHLETDEQATQEALDRAVDIERMRLRVERKRLADEVTQTFSDVNKAYTHHITQINTILRTLLARLLHYYTDADFVDLAGLEQQLLNWRRDVDQRHLRYMGLNYHTATVAPVSGFEWQTGRPLNGLYAAPTSRQTVLHIVHDEEGYVLWGTNGFRDCRRARLETASDGGHSATVKLTVPAQQLNFTFETDDHRWPGQTHTIWLDETKPT